MIHHHNYKNTRLQKILDTFSYYQKVNFAFYCSKEVELLANDQRVIDCNQVLQRWLNGNKTVDLITARTNASNAWRDSTHTNAASASYYAVYAAAASAASAVYAVYAAVSAAANAARANAYASYAAANAAVYSARAKSYNLYPNDKTERLVAYVQFRNEHNQIAQNWLSYWNIPNFPKDEPDFPIFDFLQDYNLISCLLPKKRRYYHLNLNGFDIKHKNETELLKEINTIHIKKILRRIINNDSAL